MNRFTYRTRLLSGAALGLGLAFAASPAQAACTVGATTLDCVSNTTTTDTTYPTNAPNDRNYTYNTGAVAIFGIVEPGIVVNGFGLSMTDTGTGTNALTFTNGGTIQVNLGNTPTAGGDSAALFLSSVNAPVIYTGPGSIANLGTGNGFDVVLTGTGSLNANIGGSVSSATGVGVNVTDAATSTGISVTTAAVSGATGGISANSVSAAGNVAVTNNGAVTGGTGDGVYAAINNAAGTGNVSVTANGAVTGGRGIVAGTLGTGTTTISGNGAITGTTGTGILAQGGGGNVTVSGNGAVTAAGIGIQAFQTAGNGNVSVSRGGTVSGTTGISATALGTGTVGVTTTGAGSSVTSTAGPGVITSAVDGLTTINLAGAVNAAGGDGVNATATGTGGINVTTAAVTTTGGNGITTNTTTGAQTITTNGAVTANSGGIAANSTSGAITANVNNNITSGANGVTLTSSGAKIVNVAATRTVNSTAANDITFNGGGTGVVNNSGTIGATNIGPAITTGTAAVTINNAAGGVINGVVTLAGGADAFNNTGTWNTAGTSAFGAGVDAVTNNSGGVINFATGSALTGLESLANAGTLNVAGTLAMGGSTLSGAGTLNLAAASAVSGLGATTLGGATNAGAGSSLAGTGAFSNTGTVDTAGAFTLSGFTTMSNSGTLDLAPGTLTVPAVTFTNSGTIIADEGASTITGQTNFANSGTIRLQDGATGDVLTIGSNFVGSGASALSIDASSTAADELVITGAASGSTVINVTPIGGVVVNNTGILVVDTGTSTASAFTLGSTVGTSLIDLSLQRIGQDFFLFAVPNANAFNPLALVNIGSDMWYQSADIYSNYSALKRSDLTAGAQPLGLWGQIYLSNDHYGKIGTQNVFGTDVTINQHLRTDRRGIQGGADYNFGGGVVGITGGWQRAKASLGGSVAEVRGTGWNIGGYAIVGSATGFYGGLLVKYDQNKLRLNNPAFAGLGELDSTSWGAEGEVGYRVPVGTSLIDFGGGLAFVNTKHDDFTFSGISYDFENSKSTRGRLGVRFESAFGFFLDGKVLHEFRTNNHLTLSSGTVIDTIDARGRGTWVRGELGYGKPASSGPIAALWIEGGDVNGIGGKLGFRFGGARVVAPPPPPPPPSPPPPPPPATQTCPDGSVIPATDTCPAPPPPPPPPPPAPERGF